MSWIVNEQTPQKQLAEQFRRLMEGPELLQIPGVHDGMSALIASKVGFEALYLSGAAYTASRGLPDLGIIYSDEVAEKARELVRAADLPLLADIDTGYGGVLNTARAAKEMTEAGVAAVQIEDQQMPKKCGHLNGKKLISSEEMQQKIRTIKAVAPDLVVVARTDAKAVEGIERAAVRAREYIAAGADAVFPEALTSKDDFQTMRRAVSKPLLANMTEFGKTPYFTAEEFAGFGFNMVIYPVTSMRAAAKACEQVFSEIFEKGTQKNRLDSMQTRAELYETIDYDKYESLDRHIAKTVLPEIGKEGKKP
ncbi:methylisocitrate lyase [Sporolactobacillus sp. CQH2019]|uniref:methylisocitrate lyase n=1 Tax=Sporolactobacillus sp. CQH2019 TaxID=3023512 RepID=UPI0023682A50|nr:methylisocitrate lyase [Sporolactobacillus sp. CQH2019]MDD9150077.1 methylisocitrate lyase [Sporolactobacillus sp. CQH2019]